LGAKTGDLSVTALYTCQTWVWGGFPNSQLFAHADAKRVFDATNAALAVSRLFRRDFAPLRESLVHRHAAIDALLKRSGARQVLELAAGLSRRGATFSEDPDVRYTELDLPAVSRKKRALLERTEEGRAVLARPNFRLVEGDVQDAELETWTEPGVPLFVIAEGLMMYLQPPQQRGLWERIARVCQRAGQAGFVFDLVPASEQPKPGAVGRALEAAMKSFTGGRSFERDARTRDEIAADVRVAGFDEVVLIEPAAVAEAWSLPFPKARSQQLLFNAERGHPRPGNSPANPQ
jgi:O-methyltransferase involved in polyketide biosynthesis